MVRGKLTLYQWLNCMNMKHKGTITIQTDRLGLSAFQLSDAHAAFKNWTSDERVTEFLRWPTHTDISITERVIRSWIEQGQRVDFYQWAIVLKEINEPIGTISVVGRCNEKVWLDIRGNLKASRS